MTTTRPLLAALAVLLLAGGVRADVFSPGPLSRPHAQLEGLASCTKCHPAGQQLSQETCLDCHRELQWRVQQGRGFHGRIAAAERACEKCHQEHQGRDAALVSWGPAGKKGFDHEKTGYPLRGKHARAECARCHDPRLVADLGVRDLLEKQPRRETLLGAPQACNACHFDEHRTQLGADCARCHGEDAWKPAPRFDHAKTVYPLDGKHVKVECARCHKVEEVAAATAAPGMTPPVKPAAMVRYKPVRFQSCLDCHKDPHLSRFGDDCKSCHTTEDWKKVVGAGAQRVFHDKTRYPLRGAHATATCESCHGPWPGEKAVFKNMAFGRCTDCHLDAHVGQLVLPAAAGGAAAGAPTQTCDRCHGLEGWLPVRFEEADHQRLEYRLEGAHRVVGCARCHPKDPRLADQVPARVAAQLQQRRRPVKVSLARLDVPKANDCRTCHKDPHQDQFAARQKESGCVACHGVESFRKIRFDHEKDSRYPLTGKHAKVACAACHRPGEKGAIVYRPLDLACASCHADVHAGQFAVKGKGTDCARCHETAGWKEPLRFRHEKPFTRYVLEGKHRKVECAKCHPAVRVQGVSTEIRRYKGVPTECQGCHADFHKGAFKGYVP